MTSKNNSPSQSKASTPAPSIVEIKPEEKEDEVKVESDEKSAITIEPLKVEPEEKAAVIVKTKTNESSKKKAPLLPVTSSKSPDKPKKTSKRLSAKIVAASTKPKKEVPSTPERVKASPTVLTVQTPKKKNQVVTFVPGSSIEAQNFDGKWMPVKVIEVDMEEREVLVRSCDKNNKSKTG